MSTQPPLHEVKALLKAFMDSKTTTEINIERIYKLVNVAIRENERKESALIRINAKDKAKGLMDKFDFTYIKYANSPNVRKQCALICVNEMIEQNGELFLQGINLEYYTKQNAFLFDIKTEIEKL